MLKRGLLLACTALGTFAPGIAAAQQADADAQELAGIADIIVTARRTQETLQDVPLSVTAFSGEQLEALDIGGFADIGKTVPNLDVQRQFGSASAPQFYLRGISTGTLKFEADAGIGLYIDGIYLGRPAGTAFDLADIDRVEVMRGPQGTLFGRNSTGGAINFVTAAPTGEFGVKAEGTLGNYDRRRGRITVNLPAFGPLSARVSYLHDENRGYVKNLTPGREFNFVEPFGTIRSAKTFGAENTDAVAVAVRLDAGDLTADYKFDYTDKVSTQLGQQLLGYDPTYTAGVGNPPFYTAPPSIYVPATTEYQKALALDFTTPSHLKIQGHSLTLAYTLNDNITFKSISGYRKMDEFVGGNDIDGGAYDAGSFAPVLTGLPFTNISSIQDRHQKQFTQEIQLLGTMENLEWVLGGFYFRETGRDNNPVFIGVVFPTFTTIQPRTTPTDGNTIDIFGVPSDYLAGADTSVRNKSVAGYAHVNYKQEHFELAGGVRYTKDDRREVVRAAGLVPAFLPPATYNAEFDHWDFDATATYIANPEVRAYLRFATGYLSGGVLGGVEFKPETVKSYEAGIKADLLDNTLRVNASYFITRRSNVQTIAFSAASGTFLVSSPRAKEDGFELELTAKPSRHFTFNASYGYLNQRLVGVNSLAPKNTLSVGGQYDSPEFANGSHLSFRLDGFFKDKRLSDPVKNSATAQLTTLPSRFDMNARLSLVDLPIATTKAKVSAWVQNLTNNHELEFARNLGSNVIGTFQVPRTWGVDLGIEF